MSKSMNDHISDLLSAACALRKLGDLANSEERYGEEFLLDAVRKVVNEGAEALSDAESKLSSRTENPILKIVPDSDSAVNQDQK